MEPVYWRVFFLKQIKRVGRDGWVGRREGSMSYREGN